MKKQATQNATTYDPWMQEIIDAGNAGYISPEDVKKCIEGYEEATFTVDYESHGGYGQPFALDDAFTWVNHPYGGSFWQRINGYLNAYRENHNTTHPYKKSITMKKTTEAAIKVGAITLIILALLLLLSGKADAQTAYINPDGYIYLSATPSLPGPIRSQAGTCWQELTQWGFQDATTFPHPDTLMATPITLSGTTYLVQYDGPNQKLYVRKLYSIGDATWLSPCKVTKLGHAGTTFDAIPVIELYYDLGRLTFHDFCEHEGVLQTPAAKQYYQTCVEFVNFIKNIEQ